jgi:hypothetical protein
MLPKSTWMLSTLPQQQQQQLLLLLRPVQQVASASSAKSAVQQLSVWTACEASMQL